MQWIAPSEKDSATTTLEKRLWDAADQFRANSGLKPQEYSGPILGLIFLRFAEVRFAVLRAKLEAAGSTNRRGSRVEGSMPAASQLSSGRLSWPQQDTLEEAPTPTVAVLENKKNEFSREQDGVLSRQCGGQVPRLPP